MKKIICALLTVVMLVAMIPTFAMVASAEEVQREVKLNITHLQDECTGSAASPTDWSAFWNTANINKGASGLSSKCQANTAIVGAFDEPTTVTRVELCQGSTYPQRTDGLEIRLFNPETNAWETVHTVSGSSSATEGQIYSYELDTGDTLYSKIMVVRPGAYYHNNYWAAAFTEKTYNDNKLNVSHLQEECTGTAASTNWAAIWNTENTNAGASGTGAKCAANTGVVGIFDEPTTVTRVELCQASVYQSRTNDIQVLLFNPATNAWELVLTVTGMTGTKAGTIYSFELDTGDTLYSKIQILRTASGSRYHNFLWVAAYTEPPIEDDTVLDFCGVQKKVDADNWSLRLISTVDSTEFKAVGYEVTVTGAGVNKFYDEFTQVVYSSIIDDTGVRTAQNLGGQYIFTATIHSISIENYDELTFEIRPYVANDLGQKTYGETQTYTFIDGVEQ